MVAGFSAAAFLLPSPLLSSFLSFLSFLDSLSDELPDDEEVPDESLAEPVVEPPAAPLAESLAVPPPTPFVVGPDPLVVPVEDPDGELLARLLDELPPNSPVEPPTVWPGRLLVIVGEGGGGGGRTGGALSGCG